MTAIMRRTPIGKTVDVVFIRDGETKNTKMTTISKAELDRLNEIFAQRPEGEGLFGFSTGDAERVAIPNTKMFGVKLGELTPNRPADMAGIKAGDIVLEFAGVPIRTRSEFISRVQRAKPYETVELLIMRDGTQMKISVKMGKDS
jgi:S1-C subfamily serine protease